MVILFFGKVCLFFIKKKYLINEIPIVLPSRYSGSYKMKIKDISHALIYLIKIYLTKK